MAGLAFFLDDRGDIAMISYFPRCNFGQGPADGATHRIGFFNHNRFVRKVRFNRFDKVFLLGRRIPTQAFSP